ncbi:phosphate acyltransferase [Kocuria rhizophila]|nr:phosphate acyltransferase [Kocuria rhizophila]
MPNGPAGSRQCRGHGLDFRRRRRRLWTSWTSSTTTPCAELGTSTLRLRSHKGVSKGQALERMMDGSYFGTVSWSRWGTWTAWYRCRPHHREHHPPSTIEFVKTREGVNIVSSVFFTSARGPRIVYGDCAVNPQPDKRPLTDIALACADGARVQRDRAWPCCPASTGGSGSGRTWSGCARPPSCARGPGLRGRGPRPYDAGRGRLDREVQAPGSHVAGAGHGLRVPGPEHRRRTPRPLQQSAGAVAVGPLLQGLRKPVNDLRAAAPWTTWSTRWP